MSRWRNGLLAVGVIVLITACPQKKSDVTTATQPDESVKIAREAVERTQATLREITDLRVKQLAADNALGKKDQAISDAIREYESLPAAERVRFLVTDGRLRSAWDPSDPPRPMPVVRTEGMIFPTQRQDRTTPVDFDLAIRQTDMFAQQVRATNQLFRDADPKVMSAVDAWEKMTPQQKRTFTATPEVTAYYWNYVYLTYRLQLLRHYYLYTRECYWGYRTPAAVDVRAGLDPKQFDLKVPGQ